MNDDTENARNELIKKIRVMPLEELVAYESAAISTNRFITFIGVTCLFFMLVFPSLLIILPGVILVYIMANISTGVDIAIKEIRNRLEKIDK